MQLTRLKDVYAHPGPYVTVYVDVSRNTEDANQQLQARWTSARHELEQHDVSPALVEEVGRRLQEPTEVGGEVRRLVVAAGEEVLLDEVVAGHSSWPEVVTVGELPDVSGWLHQVDGQIPFVLVVADREGADIDFFTGLTSGDATHSEVDGTAVNLHKFHGGGWSHKRFQQRSDNEADSNAREVADEVRSIVSRHHPRLVVLAGEQRPRSVIADALDGVQCEIEQVEAGGRGAGSSEEALWEQVRAVLARVEADDEQQLTGRLEERWGQGSGAVLGVDDVMSAFVQGQVDTLVVDLAKAREMTVDPSRFPGVPLPETVATAKEVPADQALVAAAAATDAAVVVLPAAQTKGGGVAALLRWSD